MARNEKTSARVARIAAKVLNVATKEGYMEICFNHPAYGQCRVHSTVNWRDIRALAASALTQAPDSPHERARKKLRGPARIRSKGPSSWPPSAKPKRGSP